MPQRVRRLHSSHFFAFILLIISVTWLGFILLHWRQVPDHEGKHSVFHTQKADRGTVGNAQQGIPQMNLQNSVQIQEEWVGGGRREEVSLQEAQAAPPKTQPSVVLEDRSGRAPEELEQGGGVREGVKGMLEGDKNSVRGVPVAGADAGLVTGAGNAGGGGGQIVVDGRGGIAGGEDVQKEKNMGGVAALVQDSFDPKSTAIVVLACERPEYLSKTITALMRTAGVDEFNVIISQDGSHSGVTALAQSVVNDHNNVKHVYNSMRQDHHNKREQAGVHYIADHYKFVMTHVFEQEQYTHAILLEEDMIVSADFLQLFKDTAPILDVDPTVMCVSSWNDNGYKHLDLDPKRLFRTGFFPGLGWMLKKELWLELRDRWPPSHWDHWLRCDSQSKGRDCVVPEVSRNHNIGIEGATVQGQAFNERLANVAFAEIAPSSFGDMSYLYKPQYTKEIVRLLEQSTLAQWDANFGSMKGAVFRVGFTRQDWHKIAKKMGLYVSSWPRCHFEHVIVVHGHGKTILFFDRILSPLAPESDRLQPAHELVATPGRQGLPCDSTCHSQGLQCENQWFDVVNTCGKLAEHFECERGCSYEVGPDIPNYVSDKLHPNGGRCLITDAIPTCEAKHPATSRLCPCLKLN